MYRKFNNEKIGNVLVFFAEKISYLPMTKAIKLLFLLDHKSISETGVPITWLEYRAWKMGPVPHKLYKELRFGDLESDFLGEYSISEFIDIQRYEEPGEKQVNLEAKVPFNDSSFCEYEIDLLEEIVTKYGHLSGNDLIRITHRKNGPWANAVEHHKLDLQFRNGISTSTFTVDMLRELSDDKIMAYVSAKEAMKIRTAIYKSGRVRS